MPISDKFKADNDFWLNIAAESLYTSFDRRAKAVESLKALITWGFGLFLSGGFVVSIFGTVKDYPNNALWAFGIGFFFLTLSYSIANSAQYPVKGEMKPLVPTSVENAFGDAVKKQNSRFIFASYLTGLGFFSIALAILFLFTSMHNKTAPLLASNTVDLKVHVQKEGSTTFIPVNVLTGKNNRLTITVTRLTTVKSTSPLKLFSKPFYADTAGRFYYTFEFGPKDSLKDVLVEVLSISDVADTSKIAGSSIRLHITP